MSLKNFKLLRGRRVYLQLNNIITIQLDNTSEYVDAVMNDLVWYR